MKFKKPTMHSSEDMACIRKHEEHNHGQTHEQNRQPESNMHLQVLRSWVG